MDQPENPETLANELATNNFTTLDDLNAHIEFLNAITAANATEIINANSMITLNMSHIHAWTGHLDELLEPFPAIMSAALNHYQAVEINLENLHIGDRGIEILADFLGSPNNANYLSLNLSSNELSTPNVQALATALESGHCPQSFSLYLNRTRLKAAGIQALSQALQSGHCPRNFILDLSRNYILSSNREGKPIADALTSGNCPEGFTL